MEIYNENMERIEQPDLTRGWLEDEVRTVHHPACEGVQEISHYETVREYPNGGRDVQKVIDVPGVQAKEAWDEETEIQIYHPYTQEELDRMEAERNRPTSAQRLGQIEAAISALLGGIEA